MNTKDIGKGKTVLLVDDCNDILESLKILLNHRGYSVVTCNSPSSAMAMFDNLVQQRTTPDLVISDYDLRSAIDGYQLLSYWKQRYPDTRYVLMSGRGLDSELAEGIEYFCKPVCIDEILGKHGNQDQAR